MAITDIGTVGITNAYNNTNTLSLTVDRDIPYGRVLVIWLATNGMHSPSDDTAIGWMFAYDNKGNIYCTVASSDGGITYYFQGGMGQIIVTQLSTALTSGDTITCWCAQPDTGPNTTVKAMSVREFDFDGLQWAHSGQPWSNAFATSAADPVSLDNYLGSTQEWLCLHAICSEGPDTDTYTWDSDYTQVSGTGTTGTGVDVHIRGGFAIVTNDDCPTVDVTSTTDRRHIQLLTGICGVRRRTFDTAVPLIDDFNRSNQNPVDGGIWNTSVTSYGSNKAQIVSNRLVGNGGSQTLATYSGECQSIYATLADDGTYPSSQVISMGDSGNAAAATFLGWVAIWEQYQAYFSGYRPLSLSYGREFGVSAIKPPLWANCGGPADGWKWGFQLRRPDGDEGFLMYLWVDRGYGWEIPGAIAWRYDHVYPNGHMGAGIGASDGAIDNLYGGDVPCITARPQIMRY